MDNCIFCKIRDGEIKSDILLENDFAFVIKDIEPIAPEHYLIISKKHFKYVEEEMEYFKKVISFVPEVVQKLGIENGYRIVINQGDNAGQSVPHLHIHILGGKSLGWEKL